MDGTNNFQNIILKNYNVAQLFSFAIQCNVHIQPGNQSLLVCVLVSVCVTRIISFVAALVDLAQAYLA